MLVEEQVNLNLQRPGDGLTALHVAALNGHEEVRVPKVFLAASPLFLRWTCPVPGVPCSADHITTKTAHSITCHFPARFMAPASNRWCHSLRSTVPSYQFAAPTAGHPSTWRPSGGSMAVWNDWSR